MESFRVGQRVVCMNRAGPVLRGELGTVVHITPNSRMVKVRWDKYDGRKHNCGGLCEWGHGFNVYSEDLETAYEIKILNISDLI